MNLLYSPEQEKNNWGYNSDVGFIPKNCCGGSNEHDEEQDRKIEANSERIARNDARDDVQQIQIDTNHAIDEEQQRLIEQNTSDITYVQNELPTLDMDGTTLVIGKKGDND